MKASNTSTSYRSSRLQVFYLLAVLENNRGKVFLLQFFKNKTPSKMLSLKFSKVFRAATPSFLPHLHIGTRGTANPDNQFFYFLL